MFLRACSIDFWIAADLAAAVTDHRQRGEGELATALDGLADTVDGDQLLDHAVVDFVAGTTPP